LTEQATKTMPERTFTLITKKGDKVHERVVSIQEKKKKSTDCQHDCALVDEDLWQIECAECGEILDPIHYLMEIAKEERMVKFRLDGMKAEYERIKDALKNRTRTRCEHCGKQTKITGLGVI